VYRYTEEGQLQRVIDDINRTGYGLSAGVFTADLEAGLCTLNSFDPYPSTYSLSDP
jgi:acyl-CoA reductase-like NAD-dependent aldehyde dehydrogenase